jgi:quercetin dioxygenase-like cupin family protein
MRRSLAVAAVILTVPLTIHAQQGVTQAGARDASVVDPEHHQVVLENEHVRVIRALASPGARTPTHSHPTAVLVSLGTSRSHVTLSNGSKVFFDLQPGQVIWGEATEHSWEMLAGQLHVIGVEIKAAARGTPPAAKTLPSNDAVRLDPVGHQVVLDNPYVRVIEGLSGAGRRSPMHSHSYALVAISLGRGRLNLTPADGNSVVVDFHPGQVLWLDAGTHSWEVVSGISNLVVIEVKSAPTR